VIRSIAPAQPVDLSNRLPAPPQPSAQQTPTELEEAFRQFVGQTLFGQMLKSMRKTLRKPAYFHGGRAEDVFQQQLDQVIAEKMSRTTAEKFSAPMFALFQMQRR